MRRVRKKRGRKRADEERRGDGRGEFSGFRIENFVSHLELHTVKIDWVILSFPG